MARVFIDPHMFSAEKEWFRGVVQELLRSADVSFLFANCEKGVKEIAKVRQALAFKKRMHQLKRAVEAGHEEVQARINWLEGQPVFDGCSDCDDPHIFAAIFLHPTRYVFTTDKRLAKCRRTIQSTVDNRYCSFIVISTSVTYHVHRAHIL